MKSLLFLLPLFGAFVAAQDGLKPAPTTCQCPQIKCPATNAAELCKCLNSRETMCKKACPTYVPTYRPCPVTPPTPIPTVEPCECEQVFCVQAWPQSCYCANAAKQKCYEKCGGPAPALQSCPPLENPTLQALAISTSTSVPKPTGTHAPCGGSRTNYLNCEDGYVCIKDPYKPGCGPACDGLGICVKDKMCGGFAGFPCDEQGQTCVDDPRDDCSPQTGGADCGGLCVWPLKSRG